MAEIINLRRARKARACAEAADRAAESRARHGRTRGEREAEAAEKAALRRTLDGAALPRDGEPGE